MDTITKATTSQRTNNLIGKLKLMVALGQGKNYKTIKFGGGYGAGTKRLA